ncbi:hydroxysqualene dehydroxylase HpnE [Nitrospinota bacterium]
MGENARGTPLYSQPVSHSPSLEGAPVVVVGAGFAGASAAFYLAESGRCVCLLEAGWFPGGRARSFPEPRSGRELDWGPHLFMTANPALRDFLGRIGASSRLRFGSSLDLTYRLADRAAPGGVRLARLQFPKRGGALAGAWALIRWRGPGPAARLSIARGLTRILRDRHNFEGETVGRMLARLGQGASERKWFWEPFSRAVLNLPMEEGSGVLFRRVVKEAFGAGLAGAALGAPEFPMRSFWGDRACEEIRRLGGRVRMASPVRRMRIEGGAVRGVVLSGGEFIEASCVIAAVPPTAVLGMLPEDLRMKSPWHGLSHLRSSPIATAYLWLDQPTPGPPFEALVNEPWQWFFRPGLYRGSAEEPVALLCGGEDTIASLSREELASAARETVSRVLPGAAIGRVLVVRERAATWAGGADEQAFRPTAETPVPGLILAGDWTATGLPATCEGAVRSGRRAAEVVLEAENALKERI